MIATVIMLTSFASLHVARNFFRDKEKTDPVAVAKMVEYIRAQVLRMDSTDSRQLLQQGRMKFIPPTVS